MTEDERLAAADLARTDALSLVAHSDPRQARPSAGGRWSVVRSAWLRHVALALLAALAAGALVFVAARGFGAALLFFQQQALLSQVAGTLGAGIEGLAGGDLRAARRELQRIDAEYWRVSLLAGALAAALAAAGVYLRLERANAEGVLGGAAGESAER